MLSQTCKHKLKYESRNGEIICRNCGKIFINYVDSMPLPDKDGRSGYSTQASPILSLSKSLKLTKYRTDRIVTYETFFKGHKQLPSELATVVVDYLAHFSATKHSLPSKNMKYMAVLLAFELQQTHIVIKQARFYRTFPDMANLFEADLAGCDGPLKTTIKNQSKHMKNANIRTYEPHIPCIGEILKIYVDHIFGKKIEIIERGEETEKEYDFQLLKFSAKMCNLFPTVSYHYLIYWTLLLNLNHSSLSDNKAFISKYSPKVSRFFTVNRLGGKTECKVRERFNELYSNTLTF